MKATEYKAMVEAIKAAGPEDGIWWDGFLWIYLTRNQLKKIALLLEEKDFLEKDVETITLPSGMTVRRETSVKWLAVFRDEDLQTRRYEFWAKDLYTRDQKVMEAIRPGERVQDLVELARS